VAAAWRRRPGEAAETLGGGGLGQTGRPVAAARLGGGGGVPEEAAARPGEGGY
jgi:hypothetical protein